ncbi:MAG: DinB family protein [bacterium]|nr:DinB family protein [bacterium]
MYSSIILLDMHTRMHRNMAVLLNHCAGLGHEQFTQQLDGFGFPTVHVQLFHTLATEWFWMSVVRGAAQPVDEREKYNTPQLLEDYRQHVAGLTADYLTVASVDELNTVRRMEVDPGDFEDFKPSNIFMRCLTHQYHHQGQVLAMCRLLGHPRTDDLDLDYPIDNM